MQHISRCGDSVFQTEARALCGAKPPGYHCCLAASQTLPQSQLISCQATRYILNILTLLAPLVLCHVSLPHAMDYPSRLKKSYFCLLNSLYITFASMTLCLFAVFFVTTLEDGAKSAFLYSRESGGIRCTRYDIPEVECHRLRGDAQGTETAVTLMKQRVR